MHVYSWNKLEPTKCVLFLQSMRDHVKSIGFFDFRTCQCYGNMIMIHLSEQINHFGMVPLLTDIYIERTRGRVSPGCSNLQGGATLSGGTLTHAEFLIIVIRQANLPGTVLSPSDCLQVQVICRLVQQQDIRPAVSF